MLNYVHLSWGFQNWILWFKTAKQQDWIVEKQVVFLQKWMNSIRRRNMRCGWVKWCSFVVSVKQDFAMRKYDNARPTTKGNDGGAEMARIKQKLGCHSISIVLMSWQKKTYALTWRVWLESVKERQYEEKVNEEYAYLSGIMSSFSKLQSHRV